MKTMINSFQISFFPKYTFPTICFQHVFFQHCIDDVFNKMLLMLLVFCVLELIIGIFGSILSVFPLWDQIFAWNIFHQFIKWILLVIGIFLYLFPPDDKIFWELWENTPLGDIYYYLKSFFAETLQIQQKNIPRIEQYPERRIWTKRWFLTAGVNDVTHFYFYYLDYS